MSHHFMDTDLERRRLLKAIGAAMPLMALSGTGALAQAGAMPKLRLQTIGANAATIPDLYAQTFDLYRKAGLDIEFPPPIYNAGGAMQMVIQGNADVTYSGGSSIVQAIQQGRKLKAVATILEGIDLKVSLTKAGMEKAARLGVTPASEIKDRVNALKGMRIAAPATGSSSDLVFRYSLQRYGLKPSSDLSIQPMPNLSAMLAATRQGVVDGVAGAGATANAQAEAQGLAERFIAFEQHDELLRAYPTYALMTTDEFLTKNPEAIKRLLIAFNEAKKAIRRGLTADEIAAVKQKFFPDMADATLAAGLAVSIPALKQPLEPKRLALDALLSINNVVADVPAKMTYEEAFAPALAAEVDKM